MDYKTAYKKLNQNGVIDEIINREVANGANLDMVKYHIIAGINHYIDFTKSSTFKGMTYWHETRWLVTDNQNYIAALLMLYARHLQKLRLKSVPHMQINYSICLMFSGRSEIKDKLS